MNLNAEITLPPWVPDAVRMYLGHTEDGLSLRALARREGRHASTILRQVRRYENRRDDPLMDQALSAMARQRGHGGEDGTEETGPTPSQGDTPMTVMAHPASFADETRINAEGRRILRRLAEPGSVLAIAPEMEKAVVMREYPDGRTARTGVLEREIAQAFALRDWISCRKTGRVATYEITSAGRAALRRMVDEEDRRRAGMAESATPFADQHRDWGTRPVTDQDGTRRVRYNLAESPVAAMGRRRDKDGKPFLDTALIEAAERLREDFELAQMGPRVAQNWDRFLTPGDRGSFRPEAGGSGGSAAARDRVARALQDLGPGLGDVVLRCCCYLEGLEVAEKRMGWAARSGKIVLRIALQRLRRHYDEAYGKSGPLIG